MYMIKIICMHVEFIKEATENLINVDYSYFMLIHLIASQVDYGNSLKENHVAYLMNLSLPLSHDNISVVQVIILQAFPVV